MSGRQTDNEATRAAAARVDELIVALARSFESAQLYFGHGTANALDEAAALVFHVLELEHAAAPAVYANTVSQDQREAVMVVAAQRISTRRPLPYLLGEAWFAGAPYAVNEHVLIPRSPIAELIAGGFEPWVMPGAVNRILEIGTGSGCIAIACALAFPDAQVVATDVSAEALAVARRNIERHAVGDRLSLVETDYADGLSGPFDLVISNPPYVPESDMDHLPAEYQHEPRLGLVSGPDGLDSARRILQDAPRLLSHTGVLVLEVGAQWEALDAAFPSLPFTWLDFEQGGEGVAVLHRADFSGDELTESG